jgi:stage II sporulation protein E
LESRAKEIYLTSGDKIILVSDGISDGFKNVGDLQDFINNISTQSPQTIADQIIQKVLNMNGNVARDDMTVIVAKIIKR